MVSSTLYDNYDGGDAAVLFPLNLGTINIGGILGNIAYLERVLASVDILAIQEHWLYPESLNMLNSVHHNYNSWGRCSSSLDLNSVWRRGKGGVAFCWNSKLDQYIETLDSIGNDSVIGIKLRQADGSFLFLISVYFPCSNAPSALYRETVDCLEDVLNQINDHGKIIILGDFNCHIGMNGGPRSLAHVNARGVEFIQCMERFSLLAVNSQSFCTGPLATYYANGGTIKTTTDFIFMDKDDMDCVHACRVVEDNSMNLLFHLPIICTLKISFKQHLPLDESVSTKCQVDWNFAKDIRFVNEYQEKVTCSLFNVDVDGIRNSADVEACCDYVTRSLISAAEAVFPRKKHKSNFKPYWGKGLSELSKRSKQCRKVWIKHGRPREGNNALFRAYKNAKREFRKALRKNAFEHEVAENRKLEAMFETDRAAFQRTIFNQRKQRGGVCKST